MSLTLNTCITSRVAISLSQTDECHSHWTHASLQFQSSTQLVQEVSFKHHWLPCALTFQWFWEYDTVYYFMMWTLNWLYITSGTFPIVYDILCLEINRDDRDGRILLKWTKKSYKCVKLTHFKALADDVKECLSCSSRPPECLVAETKPHPASHNHGGWWGWGWKRNILNFNALFLFELTKDWTSSIMIVSPLQLQAVHIRSDNR
jgi:hypothetical protein